MVDVHSPEVRAKNMRAIRSKNTKPELLIRKGLHAAGYRFRLHEASLPGKPDIVLPKYHSVIFVNGCFWHGHDCKYFVLPQTRTEFWKSKIEDNRIRDVHNIEKLIQQGWNVILIWECTIKANRLILSEVINEIADLLSTHSAGTAPTLSTISGHHQIHATFI